MDRRAATRLTALAVAIGSTWSCGHMIVHSQPSPAPLAHYADAVLSFDYPASWMVSHYQYVSNFYMPIVYLSTQPTHDPCVRTGDSTSCGDPISSLKSGKVLVVWSAWGFPGWNLNVVRGSPLQVGGRPAKWEALRPPVPTPNPRVPRSRQAGCAAMGGDESVTVWVARPGANNAYTLTACLRPANLGEAESDLRALLDSTRFTELR